MIINSIKGDGIEHLISPVTTELWGWESLQEVLIPSGADEDGPTYRESDRKITGKTIEIELHNDDDKPEIIAVMLWFIGPNGTSNIGTTPKEILPGEAGSWLVTMEERRRVIWCLVRMTQEGKWV